LDVALVHALLIVAAVVVLIVTPCVLLACLLFEGAARLFGRAVGALRRLTGRAWRAALTGPIGRHWTLVRLVRALHLPTELDPPESLPIPIEQIAADLRRLTRLRRGVATRSWVWFTAVQAAYDDRIVEACDRLGVPQYLGHLAGMDLEIERLRVEGELRAAGLVLSDAEMRHRHGQR
jgi:hypothetical protein